MEDEVAVHFRAAVFDAVNAAGGIVVVDGKSMVDKRVLRQVLRAVSTVLCDDLLSTLTPVVAGDPEAQENLPVVIAAIAGRVEQQIAELLPTLN